MAFYTQVAVPIIIVSKTVLGKVAHILATLLGLVLTVGYLGIDLSLFNRFEIFT